MRENEPVLLVFSVCEGEIILEKGEILSEKRQMPNWSIHERDTLLGSLGLPSSPMPFPGDCWQCISPSTNPHIAPV
jgi:hypothetical protein